MRDVHIGALAEVVLGTKTPYIVVVTGTAATRQVSLVALTVVEGDQIVVDGVGTADAPDIGTVTTVRTFTGDQTIVTLINAPDCSITEGTLGADLPCGIIAATIIGDIGSEGVDRTTLVGDTEAVRIIIFVFRATPLAGPGYTWFEIDELGFDQQFLSVLSLIGSVLTLIGMIVLRPMMARRSIAFVIVLLTILGSILLLPNLGLYYGLHEWTAARTGGVVDAHFIAIVDTMIESPLGQIAMIPLLAWIAKNAPPHLKATFFAVMASFTNLALSASSLGTRYINEIYTITREVKDRLTDTIKTAADYSELGWLLITVGLIGLLVPLLTVVFVQQSQLRTSQ